MELDPIDTVEQAREATREEKHARLNMAVAVTVALLATFMGICKVKDDNIVEFDLSDAFLAIAVALLAVTSLTHQRWLYWAAMVPTFFGALMGVAGLFGWPLHPSWLTSLLS
jgi:hypothetical protein